MTDLEFRLAKDGHVHVTRPSYATALCGTNTRQPAPTHTAIPTCERCWAEAVLLVLETEET